MTTPRPILLPLPLPLPFDDEVEAAVPFVLTAAAHREVLGRPAPPLTVVTEEATAVVGAMAVEDDDGPASDTRRLQARALLRSGMPRPTIAAALGVDGAQVTRWTEDMDDELARRRRRRGRPAAGVVGSDGAVQCGTRSAAGVVPTVAPEALVAGVSYAIAVSDGESVAIAHDRLEPVGMLLDALRTVSDVPPSRIRVAIRVPVGAACDRVRADVAERLGVDPSTIIVGRHGVGGTQELALRLDIRDARCAAAVDAWRTGDELRGWDSNPQTFRLTADCSAS